MVNPNDKCSLKNSPVRACSVCLDASVVVFKVFTIGELYCNTP